MFKGCIADLARRGTPTHTFEMGFISSRRPLHLEPKFITICYTVSYPTLLNFTHPLCEVLITLGLCQQPVATFRDRLYVVRSPL